MGHSPVVAKPPLRPARWRCRRPLARCRPRRGLGEAWLWGQRAGALRWAFPALARPQRGPFRHSQREIVVQKCTSRPAHPDWLPQAGHPLCMAVQGKLLQLHSHGAPRCEVGAGP